MVYDEIVQVLNKILDMKNKKIREMEIKQDEYKNIERLNLEEKINLILENPRNFYKLTLSDIKNYLELSNTELNQLRVYQIYQKNGVELYESQIIMIQNIFSKLKFKIEEKKKEILEQKDDFICFNLEIQSIERIISKLKENLFLNVQDINTLGSLIKANLPIDEAIQVISNYSVLLNSSYEEHQIGLQDLVVLTNLNLDDVTSLFKEFNLDFNSLKGKAQEEIIFYGNLDNMRNILTLLKDNKINLSLNKLLESRSMQISSILTLSNSKIIKKIIDNIKTDIGDVEDLDYEVNKMFSIYLKKPSIFIKGVKKYQAKNGKGGKESSESDILGSFQNYELNRELFIELGVLNINKIMETCPSIFTHSNDKIKNTANQFISYGIPSNIFLNRPSCLLSKSPLDIIDQFMEAGYDYHFYDYIIGCISGTTIFDLNSLELYQLINAKKNNWKVVGGRGEDKTIFYLGNGRLFRNGSILSKYFKTSSINLEYKEEEFAIESELGNIESDEVLNHKYIKKLDELFKANSMIYNFNGVIISRYKVLRYFATAINNGIDTFDTLTKIIFKNSIMTQEEHNMVLSEIDENIKNIGDVR